MGSGENFYHLISNYFINGMQGLKMTAAQSKELLISWIKSGSNTRKLIKSKMNAIIVDYVDADLVEAILSINEEK